MQVNVVETAILIRGDLHEAQTPTAKQTALKTAGNPVCFAVLINRIDSGQGPTPPEPVLTRRPEDPVIDHNAMASHWMGRAADDFNGAKVIFEGTNDPLA